MTCRIEMIALHAHGEEADLDAFFADLEKTIEEKSQEASKLWPSLEFLPPGTNPWGSPEDDEWDEYVEPPSV